MILWSFEQPGPFAVQLSWPVPNLSSPPSLARQAPCPRAGLWAPSSLTLPLPTLGRGDTEVERSTRAAILHQHISEGWGFQEPPSPPKDVPGFCPCCLRAGVTGPPGFTERWDAQAAAFTCTSFVSRSISTQNYYSESQVLWPLNFRWL